MKAAEEKMGAEITRLANEVDSSSAAVDTLKERNAKAQAAVQALRAEKDMLAQTAADEKASANAALSAGGGGWDAQPLGIPLWAVPGFHHNRVYHVAQGGGLPGLPGHMFVMQPCRHLYQVM